MPFQNSDLYCGRNPGLITTTDKLTVICKQVFADDLMVSQSVSSKSENN